MNDTAPPPLETEIDARVETRMAALERQCIEHKAAIDHWRGAALDAGNLAAKVDKKMRGPAPGRGAVLRNVLAISGLSCVGVGCWWISPAASLVSVGCVLLGAVILGTAARYRLEVERVRHSR